MESLSYWIFVVTTHKDKSDGEVFSGDDIFQQRMKDGFWGLGKNTPNRTSLRKGDQVVFYIGNPRMVFAGTAILASAALDMSENPQEQYKLSHGKSFYRADYGVRLETIQVWDTPKSAKELVPHLNFIQNKEFWGTYFQGGVRQASEHDYLAIVKGVSTSSGPEPQTTEDIESASQFALETHLEEFMDHNWGHIDFGRRLARYQTGEQDGRQFPAGPWSIDFLCTDKDNGDFVVVELKRGKTGDSTVGQILRYMGWVRENLARGDQKVRGIIVAKDVDEGLRYAVLDLGNVSLLTYKVDFALTPFSK
jgi:hypothetical protein